MGNTKKKISLLKKFDEAVYVTALFFAILLFSISFIIIYTNIIFKESSEPVETVTFSTR